jgi:hypothetical protein
MHTSDVETQALIHAQSIGFALLLAGRVDSERRLRQAQRCLRCLGIDDLVDCSMSSGGDGRYLHLRANHRLLALCPDFDTANITKFLRTHQTNRDQALISEIILAMALSPDVMYFGSEQDLKSNLRMR